MNPMRTLPALLACFLLFIAPYTYGQSSSYKQNYLSAKNYLASGKFNLAREAFKQLSSEESDNPMVPYATFFYAVATYNSGYIPLARDIFLQIEKKYPKWSEIDEVYLWQSKLGFELSGLFQGIRYARKITDNSDLHETNKKQKLAYLSVADIVSLQAVYNEYPDDPEIGLALAMSLDAEPYEIKNLGLLDSLIVKFNLDRHAFDTKVHADVFKEQYTIAVLLPLFTERLSASGRYLNKSLAVDIYEGIEMAMQDLDSARIKVLIYDTKRDYDKTANIFSQLELQQVDAMIGPLYPKPNKLANAFAYDNAINIINPVSSNSTIIEHNPYSFLMRTGAATLGRGVGGFVVDNVENKNSIIYYGTSATDSIMAYNYKARVEADSFKVVIIKEIGKENPRAIFDELTAAKQVVDSVELRRLWRRQQRVRTLPMMDSLLIQPDSIGHIFVASDNSAMASEVMSAVTSRRDTVQIVGVGSWYNGANAGLDILESMGIWLALSATDNLASDENLRLMERYIHKFHTKPSKYFFMGYSTMQFVAQSLLNYGVYFQNGYNEKGNFNPKWDFQNARDNQAMLIVQLKHGQVVQLNTPDN
jgi:hypothetical protein